MIGDDEYLERVVAGIHATTSTGAEVSWNEFINGRQFDVVVRFNVGTLKYLVLVEVKNRTRKATASDLEAFVLKARDQLANKAVFVTAAGFQEGAITVAKRHGTDLFTVTFDQLEVQLPMNASYVCVQKNPSSQSRRAELGIGEETLGACIESITLQYANGDRRNLPVEQSQMTYCVKQTSLADGRSLADIVRAEPIFDIELDQRIFRSVKLDPPQRMNAKDEYFFPSGIVSQIEWEIVGTMGRPITGNVRIDPNLFMAPVIYTNVLTGQTQRFSLDQLPLGDKRLVVGKFYFINHPLNYFHCAGIDGDLVTWDLIESFQNGGLVRATYTQKMEWARTYIPVKDKAIIKRLVGRLNDYRALQRGEPRPKLP